MAKNNDKGEKPMQNPSERKTVLAKEKKAQEAKAERESVLAKLRLAHEVLERKIKDTEASGKKIDSSAKDLLGLNALDLKNAKPSGGSKFDEAMAKVQRRMDSINSKLEAVSSSESQEPDKLHADIKKLEAEAAGEDKEFKEFENNYTESEARLGLLFDLIKNNNIELDEANQERETKLKALLEELLDTLTVKQYKDFKKALHNFKYTYNLLEFNVKEKLKQHTTRPAQQEQKPTQQPEVKQESSKQEEKEQVQTESGKEFYDKAKISLRELFVYAKKYNVSVGKKTVDDLNRKLKELSILTAPKQYENFKIQYNEFNETLDRLLSQLEEQVKAKKSAPPEQVAQEAQIAAKSESQEQKEQDERDNKYNECWDKHVLLGKIILAVDKNENGARGLADKYREKRKTLKEFLKAADEAADQPENSKVFWVNINNFNNGFKEMLANLEPDLKELFGRGEVPGEKQTEPEQKPVVESKKEGFDVQEARAFIQERKTKLKLMERIMRQRFDSQDKNYNFSETNTSSKIDAALALLDAAERSLSNNNQDTYQKNIDEADRIMDQLWDSLPASAVTEYRDRSNGKETAGTKKEKQERKEEITQWENRLALLEQTMDEKDKALGAKFAAEVRAVKGGLSEASSNLGDTDVYEASMQKAKKAFEHLTKLVGVELKNAYYAKLAGTKPESSEAIPEVITPETEVTQKIPAAKRITAKFAIPVIEQSVAEETKTAQVLVKSAAPKKGLWGRFKEGVKGVFSRETGKVAGKVTYESIASVLGLKIVTDAVLWMTTGKGDLADWYKGRKESKKTLESIAAAQKSMQELFDKAKNNKTLAGTQKTAQRIAEYKKQLESPDLPPEIKQVISEKLKEFEEENKEKLEQAKKERDEEIRRVMEVYEEKKVSGLKIARDAMNFALTATGFTMLRGLMYAGVSVVERIKKAKKKHAKEVADTVPGAAEKKFSYKDVFVDAAIETGRGLSMGIFSKEKLGAKRRTIDLLKSLGTVARALGIGGLAITHAEGPSQSIDKLIAGIKEQGAAETLLWNNLKHNAEHVWQTAERAGHTVSNFVTNPTEITEVFDRKGTLVSQRPEHAPDIETNLPVEVATGFSADQFAVEHNLSPEAARALDGLVHQYPELNNPESMQRILDASRIGGAYSDNEFLKSEIDTLEESGGERRRVIFEEILENGSPESAANYLQSQNFSSRHLGYLSEYMDKDSADGYLKFAQQYDANDDKMAYGLFRAMQGKESTTLANAGLENDSVDSRVRGSVHYFGLENKKPILSGTGEVRVIEESSRSRVVSPTAAVNEGFSTDEKLWTNANVMRSMSGGSTYDGSKYESSFANAPAEQLSADERAVLAEVEGDKDRFARMGERHIDILDRANSGKPVGEYINNTTQPEAPGAEPAPVATEKITTNKTIATFKSSKPGSVIEARPIPSAVEVKPAPAEAAAAAASESYVDVPLDTLLKDYGTDQKEFLGTLEKMRNDMAARFDNTFDYEPGSSEFLDKKFYDYYAPTNLSQVEKLLHAEELYKSDRSDWMKDLSKTMFDKDDNKVIQLGLLSHPDVDSHPILTNNSHGVRIWSAKDKKDLFWYEQDSTFNVNKAGDLVIKNASGTYIRTKDDLLQMVNK